VAAAVAALALAFRADLKPVLSEMGDFLKGVFDWTDAKKKLTDFGETVKKTARGIRNNNPGNIEYGPFAREHGATGVEAAGRFATFASAQEGLNAGAALLRKYGGQGIDSVRAIISKYAPAGENNTASYIASVSKGLGVAADAHLNLNDPHVLAGIERAIVQIENGKNPYSAEMYDKAARLAIGGSAAPVITQHITTTVNGAADPSGVAKAVSGFIEKGNGLLVRSLQGRSS